jgi:hypothetical protein
VSGAGHFASCSNVARGLECAEFERGFVFAQSKPGDLAHALGAQMEMRKETRFRLDAPALFSWENAQREQVQGEGITRDISLLGAFIVTPLCPPVDVPVHVEVVLPSLTGLKPVIRVSGPARVLRVDHAPEGRGEKGFAIISEDFSRWSMAMVFANSNSVDNYTGHESAVDGRSKSPTVLQSHPKYL